MLFIRILLKIKRAYHLNDILSIKLTVLFISLLLCHKFFMVKEICMYNITFSTIRFYFFRQFIPIAFISIHIYPFIQISILRIFFIYISKYPRLILPSKIQIFKPILINKYPTLFYNSLIIRYCWKYRRHK